MAVRTSTNALESATGRVIDGWLRRLGWVGKSERRRADLFFEGRTDGGPARVAAISPYLVERDVQALCEPCLVRFDLGTGSTPPHAWSPKAGNDTLSIAATGSGWVSGVIFSGVGPPDVLGARLGSSLSPTDVSLFFEWMSSLVNAEEGQRRKLLWTESQRAVQSLHRGASPKRRHLANRTGEMAVLAGTGAVIGLYTSVIFGPVAIELMPFTSGLGALVGLGVWGMRHRSSTRTISSEVWTVERDFREMGFFEHISIIAHRGAEWGAGMLTHHDTRELKWTSVTIEARVTAHVAGRGPKVVLHFFRLPLPDRSNPRARLLPTSWALVEVDMPPGVGFTPMGELRPVGGRSLGSWMSSEDLFRGGLKRLLEPLAAFAPRPRRGPYR